MVRVVVGSIPISRPIYSYTLIRSRSQMYYKRSVSKDSKSPIFCASVLHVHLCALWCGSQNEQCLSHVKVILGIAIGQSLHEIVNTSLTTLSNLVHYRFALSVIVNYDLGHDGYCLQNRSSESCSYYA